MAYTDYKWAAVHRLDGVHIDWADVKFYSECEYVAAVDEDGKSYQKYVRGKRVHPRDPVISAKAPDWSAKYTLESLDKASSGELSIVAIKDNSFIISGDYESKFTPQTDKDGTPVPLKFYTLRPSAGAEYWTVDSAKISKETTVLKVKETITDSTVEGVVEDGRPAVKFTEKDFGKISTDDELRTFCNGQIAKLKTLYTVISKQVVKLEAK